MTRPAHDFRHPIHVTLRARREVPPLRSQTILKLLVARLRRVSGDAFRIVHFSVQTDHLHLLLEANDGDVLARKMTGLTTWIARELNALLKRTGSPLWKDRYHRRDLATPREVRNALVYVLQNRRKHVFQQQGRDIGGVDAFSTAAWLDGWCEDASKALREARAGFLRALGPPRGGREHGPPIAQPETWLVRAGWKRAKPGRLSIRELPRVS